MTAFGRMRWVRWVWVETMIQWFMMVSICSQWVLNAFANTETTATAAHYHDNEYNKSSCSRGLNIIAILFCLAYIINTAEFANNVISITFCFVFVIVVVLWVIVAVAWRICTSNNNDWRSTISIPTIVVVVATSIITRSIGRLVAWITRSVGWSRFQVKGFFWYYLIFISCSESWSCSVFMIVIRLLTFFYIFEICFIIDIIGWNSFVLINILLQIIEISKLLLSSLFLLSTFLKQSLICLYLICVRML